MRLGHHALPDGRRTFAVAKVLGFALKEKRPNVDLRDRERRERGFVRHGGGLQLVACSEENWQVTTKGKKAAAKDEKKKCYLLSRS